MLRRHSSIAAARPLEPLPDQWEKLKDHPVQLKLVSDTTPKQLVQGPTGREFLRPLTRFPVVPAGRRSGKTERAKRCLVRIALKYSYPGANYFFGAPTRDQAKRIFWGWLKTHIPRHLIRSIRETDLSVLLKNGVTLVVIGMDKPERLEGSPWDGGVLDEYGNMKPEAFMANVRPALSDRMGFCWLIGVPEGRNHYYDRYVQALEDDTEVWNAYTWWSEDILPASEIEQAMRDMDELTFRQEYRAEFVNFVGQAYYPFQRETHCANIRDRYSRQGDLIVCFDFNVDPGVCVIAQEMTLPIERRLEPVTINGRKLFGTVVEKESLQGTGVIGEVHIPVNSNTPAVCRALIDRYGQHNGRVFVYGDATGGARGTAQTEGSDWDLIKNALYGHYGPERVIFRVPESNPTERARINAVNSRLLTGDGGIHLMVDPVAAPNLVVDFEGVRLLEGGSGEIDKKRDPKLTHLSDAIGYYIAREYPIREDATTSTPLKI